MSSTSASAITAEPVRRARGIGARQPLLRLEAVSFVKRGQALLDSVSLALAPGLLTVVLGANGAGKSLLLRLCHGLLDPTSGRIHPSLDRRGREAMVFQRPVMLRRSVAANIRYAVGVAGTPRHEREALARAALERAGLTALARRSARVLSGGEQQRLALARAWTLRPAILFLDEPTASLDPGGTRAIEELVRLFHAEGTKVVMTTHDLGQARRLADDIVFLHRGRLIEHTAAEPFFERPRSREAAAFLDGELLW